MELLEKTSVMWVVLDAAGEVMVICSGRDAPEAVEGWAQSGYRVVACGADEVRAA